MKWFLFKVFFFASIVYAGYYYFFKRDIIYQDNICHIYDRRPLWESNLNEIQEKSGIDKFLILSIIKQESAFDSHAKPPFVKLFGMIPIPWKRQSSSFGYTQAIEASWELYQSKTNNLDANPTYFTDSIDFISWYVNRSTKINGIDKNDFYNVYLSYHEGWGGFNKKTYNKKPKLKKIAKKVERIAKEYAAKEKSC